MPDTVSPTSPQKRRFHTLNALRFFAALNVFLHHLPFKGHSWVPYLEFGGGTHLFFILSGFLITYWILEEKQHTGKFNLKNFHARRILRIWPLFYLLVALCYLLPALLHRFNIGMTSNGYDPNPAVSFLFLENYKMILTHSAPDFSALGSTWAICVQEHFYVVWSILLFLLPVRRMPLLIAVSIVISIAMRAVFVMNGYDPTEIVTSLDSFAYGAIPAYVLIVYPGKIERIVLRIPAYVQYGFVLLMLVVLIKYGFYFDHISRPLLYGVPFTILLLLTLTPDACIKISEQNIVSRLGIYAYGIFVYHTFIIVSGKKLCDHYSIPLGDGAAVVVFIIMTFAVTLCCAALSYKYFEQPFLKLKRHFRK